MKATIQNIIQDFGLIQSQKFSYQYEKEIFDGNYFLVKINNNKDNINVIRVYSDLFEVDYFGEINIFNKNDLAKYYETAKDIIRLVNSIYKNEKNKEELKKEMKEEMISKFNDWRTPVLKF